MTDTSLKAAKYSKRQLLGACAAYDLWVSSAIKLLVASANRLHSGRPRKCPRHLWHASGLSTRSEHYLNKEAICWWPSTASRVSWPRATGWNIFLHGHNFLYQHLSPTMISVHHPSQMRPSSESILSQAPRPTHHHLRVKSSLQILRPHTRWIQIVVYIRTKTTLIRLHNKQTLSLLTLYLTIWNQQKGTLLKKTSRQIASTLKLTRQSQLVMLSIQDNTTSTVQRTAK